MENNNTNSQLVFIENEKVVTDSLMVAEVFEKRHDSVLRDIRELDCSEEFSLHNFVESDYMNDRGKVYQRYTLTKNGLMFLVMGYRGEKAAVMKERYIGEFDRMEQFIKSGGFYVPSTLHEALRLAADLEKERMLLEDKLTEQAPKVEFHDKVLRSKELLTVTTIAKDFGMSAIEFNRLLHLHGIQYRQGNKWHLYDRYADKGYVDYVTYEQGNTLMRWTQKGRLFLYELLKEQRILPAC
ncbi:phage regulatory protein, rha family [Thermoactinomyces sp. DSM 45891]|uniref:Rha family transcriptional regulator n=1 Tax=Thermoactinomyces sp. DSM 45891 TaxID=1761907 RepID=UPI000916A561|nr:phage regulatory protein/antirepressor Ant [Thermoactinomyces sp. DSM 45891]SFX47378.1 phage regulatory protein, rha family [Thermoactinomyces sp. DSM 45891]